jgi:hypothetical protein
MRQKADYALLWANGMTFAEVYDLMKADIEAEIEKGYDTAHEGCCNGED